jgi:hypothetical protein
VSEGLSPTRRVELEQRRRELQDRLRAEALERQRRAPLEWPVAQLDQRGVGYAIEDGGVEAWRWIETHFPIRTVGMHDAFIDWDRVTDGEWYWIDFSDAERPTPHEWLAAVQDRRGLGDPEVTVMWERDLTVRIRFADVVANADVVDHNFYSWVVCTADRWVIEFRAGDYYGWARSAPGA